MKLTAVLKRLVLGPAMRSEQLGETLLPKRLALPVFASDALSSNAYATQEILLVLSIGGAALLGYAPWIAALVVFIYFIVVASYRQNVHAYPSGGGDYEVVATNMGERWGVFVASALLIDYILTVAVSISAAVANIASAVPSVGPHVVPLAVGCIVFVTAMNLRGVRESGAAFAIPTYLFMFTIFSMIIFAAFRLSQGDVLRAESAEWTVVSEAQLGGLALVFILARAFSSGTTALTGIEAISNGVPAFKKPKSKNAATTLLLLGLIAMSMFSGLTWLALETQVRIAENAEHLIGLPEGQAQKTVIAQVAGAVFNVFPPGFYAVAVTTALILILAANTAFNGFPVLGSVLARDGYLPRQLHTRGDRLAFSNGIIALAALAAILVVIYQADVTKLIQLYIIGVFVSFSLSQFSMMRHWKRLLAKTSDPLKRRPMLRSRVVNFIGFLMTSSVLVIVLVTKFLYGAWLIVIAMPVLFFVMRGIKIHYEKVAAELEVSEDKKSTLPSRVHAIVTVSKVHRATLRALNYARASRPTVLEAVTVNVDQAATDSLVSEWERRKLPVTLRVLDSPYREITRPILDYVASIRANSTDIVIVYVPEYVVGHWWEQFLHNQSAFRLKARLRYRRGVIVASVPFQLDSSVEAARNNARSDDRQVRRRR